MQPLLFLFLFFVVAVIIYGLITASLSLTGALALLLLATLVAALLGFKS